MLSHRVFSSAAGPGASMLSCRYANDAAKLLSDPLFVIVHSPCCFKTETNIDKYEHCDWIIPAHTADSVKDAQF